MKSPDRDAADELVARLRNHVTASGGIDLRSPDVLLEAAALIERLRDKYAGITEWEAAELIEQQASELATLRRRVAEMEGGIAELLRCSVSYHIMGDAYEKLIALSPPTRKE